MGVYPTLDSGYKPAATAGMDTRRILEAAAAGELDTLLIVGADPVSDYPDADLATRALEGGAFTIVVELFPTATVERADVVLPSVSYAERAGTFTNLERRLQRLEPLVPTRGTAREPWGICSALAAELGEDWGWTDFDSVWADIRKEVATHADLDVGALRRDVLTPGPHYESGFGEPTSGAAVAGPGARYPKGYRSGAPFQTGQNWPLSWELRAFEAREHVGFIPPTPVAPAALGEGTDHIELPEDGAATGSGTGLALYTGRLIYDDGTMVRRSTALTRLAPRPYIEISDVDATNLALADGDDVVVSANGTAETLRAVIADISEGAVFIPFHQPGLRASRLISGADPMVEVRRP
jgi:predicted molibdopterin-dependent oxidoreductase YjgC